jgi:hypothetical protein
MVWGDLNMRKQKQNKTEQTSFAKEIDFRASKPYP